MAEVSATVSWLMKFDINAIVKSKEAFRLRLAALPVAEKLRLLDAMRERAVTIRGANPTEPRGVREEPSRYGSQRREADE